jgi:prepilin-type N-terminal cleavage/methylation domain-containing protein
MYNLLKHLCFQKIINRACPVPLLNMKLNFSKIIEEVYPAPFFYKKNGAGFTLIELLVVIAIIGVLSAIVLASLNNSRISAADASIKANLIAIRSQAAIYLDTYGTYGVLSSNCNNPLTSMFRTDSTIQSALLAISKANGGFSPTCKSNTTPSTSWFVIAQLKSSGNWWCVDYTGASVPEGSGSSYSSTFYTCN